MKSDLISRLASAEVLYYPTIEFQSDGWLKAALCVWDKVSRIVPSGYKPKDSDEVKLAIDSGLIEPVILTESDLSQSADSFITFMKNAAEIPAALQGHDVRLHVDKVDYRLVPLLKGLARDLDPSGWLTLPPEIANAYMLYLAETVAKRRQIQRATDNEDVFAVHSFFSFNGNFSDYCNDRDASEVAASVILPQIVPPGVEQQSMERILDFRKRHEEARYAYRERVLELAEHLTKVEDINQTRKIIEDFDSSLSSAKSRWPSLGGYGWAGLAVGIPMALSGLLTVANPSWAVIAGLISVSVIATMADPNKSTRPAWKRSDAFYHLALNKTFAGNRSPEISSSKLQSIFYEFMDD
jgi:hypothetical protein